MIKMEKDDDFTIYLLFLSKDNILFVDKYRKYQPNHKILKINLRVEVQLYDILF